MTSSFVQAGAALVLGAALGACAHVEFKAPEDPVEEVRLRLADLTATEQHAVCAAEKVEEMRTLIALQGSRPEQSRAQRHGFAKRYIEADDKDFSQLSAAAASALEYEQEQREAALRGDPSASRRARNAMLFMDAWMLELNTSGAVEVPIGARSAADMAWAEAEYASAWSAYFTTESDEDRAGILDWLTSRSMAEAPLLRAYHEDFTRVLRRLCD